jgi:site-specific DNA-methyltransferase (adenine-specific)
MTNVPVNSVIPGDALAVLATLPAGCVNLAFADPPFNIGLAYPGYDDNRPPAEYLAWLRRVFTEVRRVLARHGSVWVAIGPQFQAEVPVLLRELGFYSRNTVIWHYTFGPHQKAKFVPSWAALHYLVRDPARFTFNQQAVLVPSARQLVYKDSRAKAGAAPPTTRGSSGRRRRSRRGTSTRRATPGTCREWPARSRSGPATSARCR